MGPESTSTTTPGTSDSAALAAGDLLCGRYRVVEQLGSGGFGQVLSAEDLQEGRRVAIKILRADAGKRDPAAVARMRQEAQILGVIDHPNIVEIYDVDESEHGEFMVMELLEGKSLDQIMADEGPAEPERVRPLAKQLLSALAAAHGKQVLHRDLKPDNIILVASEDEPGAERAKLLDFGVAKAQEILDDDPDAGITLVQTRGGGFVGTPRYCAPETAVGDPAGPSADLFSLGLVLSEWLTGTARIEAEKQNQVLAVLIRPEPLDVSDCPGPWQPWFARLLAKDPDERYASAKEALNAFEALVERAGDDVDLAKTEKQTPIHHAHMLEAADASETADTLVREAPTQDSKPSPPPAAKDSAGTGATIARFILIAALSCGFVLLLLMLARSLF